MDSSTIAADPPSSGKAAYLSELLEAGKRLIEQGFPIIPCDGKKPFERGWGLKPTHPSRLETLKIKPEPMVGLLMGEKSGIIDVETDDDAEVESVRQLFEGCEPVITVAYNSSRGRHSLYKYDQRLADLETDAKGVFTYGAVKIRFGAGGKQVQSIIPPSPGREWLPGLSLENAEVKPLPDVVIQRLLDYAKGKKQRPPAKSTATDGPKSQRSDGSALLKAMRTSTKNMVDGSDGSNRVLNCCIRGVERDATDAEIVATIRLYEQNRPFPRGWTDAEIVRRIRDAEQRPDVERGSALVTLRPLTDLGNGERFVAMFGDSVRYIHVWGKWLVWDSRRWRLDNSGMVMRMAKQSAKAIYREAEFAKDEEEQEEIVKFAKSSQSRHRLEAKLELAKSEEPIPMSHEAFDTDPWLLNCDNGTVDLRTGNLQPHDPGDLITKTTGTEYPDWPGCDAPLWNDFLWTIFDGNSDLIAFVQRLMGSALPGVVQEHILPIFYGTGANGKSVFIEAVMAAMGEYAMKAPAGLLMTTKGERHPTELADLYGKRLVAICETGDGQRLDERLVKETTGGDTIRARRMREDFWQFTPSHLTILVTNYKPVVRGTDFGLWRRLRLVPFTVTIPESQQDKRLPEKLKAELTGILKWMVEGCLRWQREGLNPPPEVMLATEGYKAESDTFAQWFEECLVVEGSGEVKASVALKSYQAWCEEHGERPVSGRMFSLRILERNVTKRLSNGTYYQGIRFISQ